MSDELYRHRTASDLEKTLRRFFSMSALRPWSKFGSCGKQCSRRFDKGHAYVVAVLTGLCVALKISLLWGVTHGLVTVRKIGVDRSGFVCA